MNRNKIGTIMLITLVLTSVIVTAGILSFLVKIETGVTVEPSLLFDGIETNNLVINENFNCIAGNTTIYPHTIKAFRDMNISFIIEDCEEVNVTILFLDNPITEMILTNEIEYTIYTKYTVNPLATSGIYYTNISLEII